MMTNEYGKCISQLKEVFDNCDESGSGSLDFHGLKSLCKCLHLSDEADRLIEKLLEGDDDATVDFESFKEAFISLLIQSEGTDKKNDWEDEDQSMLELRRSEREISPKFVLGAKKYGRRSRPAQVADEQQENHTAEKNETAPSLTSSYKEVENGTEEEEECDPPHSSMEQSPVCLSRTASFHSQLDQEGTQWSSPEEFLCMLWKRLKLGSDANLNEEELACVCKNIGMETTPETVRQLFEKLDTNNDGSVSFDELLQGLFQYEKPNAKPEMSFTCSPVNHGVYKGNSQEDIQICESAAGSSIFSSIDLDNEGYVSASSVADLWESLGFNNGIQILRDLGFNISLKISVFDLTLLLEEELVSACSDTIYQVALHTLQNELNFIRSSLAQIRAERNKLKCGLLEANNRAILLAQEVDEHHAKLEESSQQQILNVEKKHQEQMRDLQEELRKEREALSNQIAALKQELEEQLDEMQDLEANFKRQLSLNDIENTRLESELQDTLAKCVELENQNSLLQKELSTMTKLRQKLEELESSGGSTDNLEALNKELEELRKEKKDLQDHIDQLTLEIEQLKMLVSSPGQCSAKQMNRVSSWLGDYNKGLPDNSISIGNSLKRRGSASSSDGNSEDESRMVGKIRRRLSITFAKDELNMECSDLEDDLVMNMDGRISNKDLLSPYSKPRPKFHEAATSNPNEEMTKQLTEELKIKSQIIAEKDAVIAKLKKDVLNVDADRYPFFAKQHWTLSDNKKCEITFTIQDLHRMIRGVLSSSSSHVSQLWLQNSIDECFTKIYRLIELENPSDERFETDCRLTESTPHRMVVCKTPQFPSAAEKLLKDLYVENARLMKELQLAEQQQRRTEQSNGRMQHKCKVLTKLLAEVTCFTTKGLPI